MAQPGEVLGSMAGTDAAVIFPKRDLSPPVPLILAAPMAPHRLGEVLHVGRDTGQRVALLAGPFAPPVPLGFAFPHAGPRGPRRVLLQFRHGVGCPVAANFHPPMRLVRGFVIGEGALGTGRSLRARKERFDGPLSGLLLAVEGSYILATICHNLLRNRPLTAHCLNRHQPPAHL